jgi:hypothetical protein
MPQAKYQSDDGDIHPIRLSQDSIDAAGAAPAGAIDSDIRVKVSKGNREFGIRPRGVNLVRTVGTAPNEFTKRKFLPVLTETAFDSATFAVDADIDVGSVSWKVGSKQGEDF